MARVQLRLTVPGILLGLALVAGTVLPAAADFAPAPFAPQVGSRWRVTVTDTTTDSIRGTTRTLSYGFELTYEAREGEGYRILYVLKDVEAEGNAPSVPVARAAVEALKDVPVRAVTDGSGKPIRVENEAEVAAAVRALGARYIQSLARDPQLEALVRRVFDELAGVHGAAAAEAYLAPLPLLADAQNTSLRPGEERRSESALGSPFGGAIKSLKTLALAPDPRPDRYVVVESEALDEASLKAAIAGLTAKLVAQGGVTAEDARAHPPEITLSITRSQRVAVDAGMARSASMREMTKAKFAGQDGERARTTDVSVAPAP